MKYKNYYIMSRTINNNLKGLNDALIALENESSFENSLKAVNEIVSFFGIEPDLVPKPFNDSRGKIKDHAGWFMEAQGFGDRRACYKIAEANEKNLDLKLYWVQKPSKRVISTAVALTPNFEDEPFYQKEGVGIDFIVPKEADRIIVAISNNYTIRTIELHGGLSVTQQEIFAKWNQPFDFANKKEVHATLWSSFDLEPLNKRFYQDVTRYFTELVQYLTKEKELDNKHAALFTNRLIGRLIFCWFLKKKGIISNNYQYFEVGDQASGDYYKQKLEALFFNVLNTPIGDREKLAGDTHNLFGKVKGEQSLFTYDTETPFLNGGLFEPREGDYYGQSKINFPKDYFHRFFQFLNHYNFTTDESTSSFQQVAIDPEMLGRIFENLLAEQTEDTGEQARKAKGAFYTPREIVDYMCRESLRAYIAEKLPDDDKKSFILELLFDKKEHEFDNRNHRADLVPYKKNLLEALDQVKVLDPACGSGAFPMGMLQLILVLYERLETRFDAYKTKMSVIQNNLHGIDIEPMAVEIARLRVWLSIVVDEELNPKSRNMGIDPLPNLDFKFVCANSLIPLEKDTGLFDDETIAKQMQDIRDRYFNTESVKIKNDMKKKFLEVLRQTNSLFATKKQTQLSTYKPFDTENSCSFFDPEFMFGLKGFNIVIGNPPYVSVKKISVKDKKAFSDIYESGEGRFNLFTLFLERGHKDLIKQGILSYILPEGLYSQIEYRHIRKYLLDKSSILLINLFSNRVFDAAVDTSIIMFKNELINDNLIKIKKDLNQDINKISQNEFLNTPGNIFLVNLNKENDSIIRKLQGGSFDKIRDILEIQQGIIYSGQKREDIFANSQLDDSYKKILDGRDILKWKINWQEKKENRYIKYSKDLHRARDERLFLAKEKLVMPRRATQIVCSYDDKQFYLLNTAYILLLKNDEYELKYIQAILNSKLIDFYYKNVYSGWQITIPALDCLPIKKENINEQKKLSLLVDRIKEKNESGAELTATENEIDEIIYDLYGLNEQEKDIIRNT